MNTAPVEARRAAYIRAMAPQPRSDAEGSFHTLWAEDRSEVSR